MRFILFLSEAMVPLMIFYIVGFGLLSGRPVLDDFIDGAKEGMRTVAGSGCKNADAKTEKISINRDRDYGILE